MENKRLKLNKIVLGLLSDKVKHTIELNSSKWHKYVVRPSNLIDSPESPFYKEQELTVKKELEYLADTRVDRGVWRINWTWEGNSEKYPKEFAISENWWKASKAIDYMLFLRRFEVV